MSAMKRILPVLGILAGLGLVGCADDLGAPHMPGGPIQKPAELADVPLCRVASGIQGRDALVFQVLDTDGLLAVDIDDQIVCVDDASGVVSSGVNPVTVLGSKPANFPYLDTTPLPMDSIKGMIPSGP